MQCVPEILKILFNEAVIHRNQSVEHIPTKAEMTSRPLLAFLLHAAVFTSLHQNLSNNIFVAEWHFLTLNCYS